jgi:hypothetical protein
MTLDEAREILAGWIEPDGSLRGSSTGSLESDDAWIWWMCGDDRVSVDGHCDAAQLTALAVWITQAGQGDDHDR